MFIVFVVFFVFILLPRHKSRESVKIGPHPMGHPSSNGKGTRLQLKYSWRRFTFETVGKGTRLQLKYSWIWFTFGTICGFLFFDLEVEPSEGGSLVETQVFREIR
jgi:hypothetical protein